MVDVDCSCLLAICCDDRNTRLAVTTVALITLTSSLLRPMVSATVCCTVSLSTSLRVTLSPTAAEPAEKPLILMAVSNDRMGAVCVEGLSVGVCEGGDVLRKLGATVLVVATGWLLGTAIGTADGD